MVGLSDGEVLLEFQKGQKVSTVQVKQMLTSHGSRAYKLFGSGTCGFELY